MSKEATAPHRPDERFIPVRVETLARAIQQNTDRFGDAAGCAASIAESIEAVIEQEARALFRWLDDAYAKLNPDADTVGGETEESGGAAAQDFSDALEYALDKANYRPLGEVQIQEAIEAGSTRGIRVKLRDDRVYGFSIHARGVGRVEETRRQRWRPWRTETFDVDVYRRLAVIANLKGEPGVRLKLFRDIPITDVEALLPHAEVTMTTFDRIKVFGGGAGSLGGAAKAAFGGLVLSRLMIPLLIGLGGLAVKSFLGYRTTLRTRAGARTMHLYDQNLANNAAVLDALVRMIANEEIKEALLAYTLLASDRLRIASTDQLDQEAERFLLESFNLTLDFDHDDALETLQRLRLLESQETLRVAPPPEAKHTLGAHWSERRTESYHTGAIQSRRRATGP